MSGDGRTVWWAKDALWYDRERQVVLGDEFGAEGTTVLDVLSCLAKLENNGGRVKTGYLALTKKGNIKSGEQTTRKIVARAVEIGALDDFSEDRLTFTARVSGWKADQDLARAAVRQDRHRATAAPKRDAPSRGVTDRDRPSPTGQERTEQQTTTENDTVEPGLDQATGTINQQVSELFGYWQEQCGHPHAKLTDDRRTKIRARLREGYTPDQIRAAIDGAAKAAYVDDDTGKRHDDIELICRKGSKLEDFISRATTTPSARRGRGQAGNDAGQRSTEQTAWCLEHFPDLCTDGSPHPGLLAAIFRLGGLSRITMPDDEHRIRDYIRYWLGSSDESEAA